MQSKNKDIAITETTALSDRQIQDIRQLVENCCRHDRIRLSYPAENTAAGMDEGEPCDSGISPAQSPRHWLCCGGDGMLLSALALVFYEDSPAECIAFTHPAFRRRGLFSRLLECALAYCEDCDILFAVSGHCQDTCAVLQALEAELVSEEHQMELELTESESGVFHDPADPHCFLRKTCVRKRGYDNEADDGIPSDISWELICADTEAYGEERRGCDSPEPSCGGAGILCGSCLTTMVSDICACLHHVEILPSFRRQGFGQKMVCLLLSRLYGEGVRRVILQVSGDNQAAISLYKKTGFGITETLSFYLY